MPGKKHKRRLAEFSSMYDRKGKKPLTRRNFRVKARYDELMQEGKHGHYETMFRVVREEIERDRALPDRRV